MSRSLHVVSHAETREGLNRILASADFDTSDRNRRFLAYIVEEMLSGRGDRIKAYSIATSVFGRDERFDPQVNSIVRIEAGRLRRSLERYYLTSGAADPIRISIPRGTYVPEVHFVAPAAAEAVAPPSSPEAIAVPGKLRLFVTAFEMENERPGLDRFSQGLTRQIIAGLTRFQTIVVYCSAAALGGDRPAGAGSPEPDTYDLVLSGGTSLTDHRLGVEALLTDARDGRLIWGESFDRHVSPSEAIEARDDIAGAIVRTLAQPYGVLFAAQVNRSAAGRESGAILGAVAMFHVYKRNFDGEMYDTVRLALEDAIVRDPTNAEAFACLSQIYSAAVRFRLDAQAPQINPIQRALSLAHRAIELAPRMSFAFLSLAVAKWFAQDVEGTFASLNAARELNPNDTEVMAELGMRRAFRMQWECGISLLDAAYARNPALPGTYRIAYSVWHFAHGRFAEALQESQRVNAPRVIYQHVMVAVSAHALGDQPATEAAIKSVLAIDPHYLEVVDTDLLKRNLHPDLCHLLSTALRAAAQSRAPVRKPPLRDGDARAGKPVRLR